MKGKRLHELDALRGIAAITIVIHHYFFRFDQLYGHPGMSVAWADRLEYAVQLFFMVSGFVIYWTLGRVKQPMDFVVSRFSRLYPAYWASIVLTFSIVHLAGLPGREIGVFHTLINFSMLQEFLRVPPADGVYWTLTIELIFYFWMFLFYLVNRLEWVEMWFSAVALVSIGNGMHWMDLPVVAVRLFLVDYAAFFLSGICLYKISNGTASKRTFGVLAFSLASTLANVSWIDWSLFLLFHVAFYLAVTGRMTFLATRSCVFLGAISYSLYLIHQNIGYVIIRSAYAWNIPPLAGIAMATAVSLGLAMAVHKWIETPAMARIRRAWKG